MKFAFFYNKDHLKSKLSIGCLILAASLGWLQFCITNSPFAIAAPPDPGIPPGFHLIAEDFGVFLYRKDYSSGSPDFVQAIDLSNGARLLLMHGSIEQPRLGKGVYGGDDPRMISQLLENYWQQASATEEHAFCITNGGFFYMPENPTRLAFPLKVNGKIITDGWGINTYPDQKIMLELWETHAEITKLTKDTLYTSSAPNIIAGLTVDANKRAKHAVGRTFVGIDDRDGDFSYETVLILNTLSAIQAEAAAVLINFGAEKVMMLDGGGSTQLICKSGWHVRSERPIPQALTIIAAAPPLVSTELINYPTWQILLEGEHYPLEIEIKNTGIVSWIPGKTFLVMEPSSLGSQERIPMGGEVKPGETVVISNSLAAFTRKGVYPAYFNWFIEHEEKTYPGKPIDLNAVIIPTELEGQRSELKENIALWLEEQPGEIENLVMAWIDAQLKTRNRAMVIEPVNNKYASDVVWIPILMLPIMFLLAKAISRERSSD